MTGTIRVLCMAALGLAAFIQTGCIAAIAGAAGAGAVAGYMYYNGLLYRDYRSNLTDSLAGVRTALANQKFVIDREATDAASASIETKSADGSSVRVHLEVVPSAVPGEAPVTRVGVRVGFSGDEALSARLLDEISRLLPPVSLPPVTGFTPSAGSATVKSSTPTAPPPLAPLQPVSGASDPNRLVPIPAGTPIGSK